MQLGAVDIVVMVIVVVLVASRFLKFKLPRDERPRAERPNFKNSWREMVEKFQPAAKPQAELEPLPSTAQAAQKNLALRTKGKLVVPKGLTGVAALKAVDAAFNETTFIKGARDAYLFFHEKWAGKDEDALAQLCSPRLLDEIANHEAGKSPGKASDIKTTKIAGARLNGRTAVVDVDFEAKHGKTVLKSRWTLARAVGGLDPNWELQSITAAKAKK